MTTSRIDPPAIGALFRLPGDPERTGGSAGAGSLEGGPRVLLLPHDGCAICSEWAARELGAVEQDVRGWGGRILHLAPELRSPWPGTAWLAVVDEWDEVYHVAVIGPDHAFPDARDVVEWVRFVAIQCPECEAPEWPWVES